VYPLTYPGGIPIKTRYQSLKDLVYDYIAQKIQDGSLLPNDKINESTISKELDVSRTPIREALIQLASEQLLEYLPRRGFIVKEIDLSRKLDVFRIVGVLDALAGTLALECITTDDLDRMEDCIKLIDYSIAQRNYADYQKYQKKFHSIYINQCKNPTLITMLSHLQNSFIRQVYLSEDDQKLFDVSVQMNNDHRKIIECFQKKDVRMLEQTIKNHWEIEHTDMI
jgi:DNA-binding GntR family transcriptional regulator